MYMRNRIGPKTEPCGIPDVNGTDSDFLPSGTTVCNRLPRKARIQRNEFPLTLPEERGVIYLVKGL